MLSAKPGSELIELHTAKVFACTRAHGQGTSLGFPVSGDQQVRNAFQCVLADFKADLLVSQV
jgi:hypothetical protein